VGSQCQSLTLVASPEEAAAALEASRQFQRPIATAIEKTGPFWAAEEDQQRYLEKRGLWGPHPVTTSR
jgi:peptide methionine sulfoxide reductase MsrA